MLPDIERRLRRAIGNARIEQSRGARDAERIAATCVRQGATTVLSLGGDGTHGEVINGIFSASPAAGSITFGALHAGTGGDFRRMLTTEGSLEKTLHAIKNNDIAPLDIGKVSFVDDEGSSVTRWFLNVASCGVSGEVDQLVNRSRLRLGGTMKFLVASTRALTRYRPARVRVTVDGEDQGTHLISLVVVCNGRFAGGGMQFAPEARLGDGQFEVLVIQQTSLLSTLSRMPRIYAGTHTSLPQVKSFRGAEVTVTPVDDLSARMDIDGESPGSAPATFRVLPAAIKLLGARPECV